MNSENTNYKASERKPFNLKNELYDWAEITSQVLIVIVLLFIFIIRNTGIEGNSMVPTLHNRDIVLISNLFYEPKPGDIVVLTKYGFEPEPGKVEPIVKRIIATEGQVVDINFDTNEVRVDGKLLNEPYINEPTRNRGDVAFPVKVPAGCIFVLGDNRNNSTDSRLSIVGMIDKREILGKVVFKIPSWRKE
jgi:signal peptidase I